MARAIWSGTINFGLVTVPVELYRATGDHAVRFRQFQRGTSDRVRYRRVNERTGKEVPSDEIVKGYELEDGDYVIVEPAELEEIAPGRSRTIDIDAFVDLGEIDPIYFDSTYWLLPTKEEFAKAYQLLLSVLSELGQAGVARFVMHGREHLAAIRPAGRLLIMERLLFAEDVRVPEEQLGSLPQEARIDDKEFDMARRLVESMREEWDPEKYPDTYTERVMELIDSKREGRSVVTESGPPEPTKVVDLFDALSRSVEGNRGGSGTRRGKRGEAKRRGSRRADVGEMSKADLESMARELGIRGRSKMNRADLEAAVGEASGGNRKRAS